MSLNDLSIKYNCDKGVIKHNYTFIYDFLFKPEWTSVLEIGVDTGASIKMWVDYFPNAEIYGIDINEAPFSDKRYTHITGDQSDSKTYSTLQDKKFDLIIDDGSHMKKHILFSFGKLAPLLKTGGIYIVEDLDSKRAKNVIEKLNDIGFYIINNKFGIYKNEY